MDLNVRAFRVVQAAFVEQTWSDPHTESSRKGGLRGGPARAKSISAERRSAIARMASKARWSRRAEKQALALAEAK
jgi:hypothetical protein